MSNTKTYYAFLIIVSIVGLIFLSYPATATVFTDNFNYGTYSQMTANGWHLINGAQWEFSNVGNFAGNSDNYTFYETNNSAFSGIDHPFTNANYWQIDMRLHNAGSTTVPIGCGNSCIEFKFLPQDAGTYNSIAITPFNATYARITDDGMTVHTSEFIPYAGNGNTSWYHFEISKSGTSITFKIYNEDGSLLTQYTSTQAFFPVSTTVELHAIETGVGELTGMYDNLYVSDSGAPHPPGISSWSNNKTNNVSLNILVNTQDRVTFNATANQTINTWSWFYDSINQSTNFNNITFNGFASGNHTLTINATNGNGTSNTIIWNINATDYNPSITGFDPNGYVKDGAGNPIQGAKVVISNATYTDACLLTSCYSDSTGFWGGTIYSNGTYNFNVSKQGYATLTGSQAFTIGGVNNNFTLTAAKATLTGHVYTTLAGTGTTSIKGNLQDLRVDSCGIATGGGTLTLGTSGDGHLYVLKLLDVDSGNQQSDWQLLKDGSVLYDNQIVQTNTPLQLKIYETFYENVYVDIRVSNVFQGSSSEFNTATTCGSFEHASKGGGLVAWLLQIIADATLGNSFTFLTPTLQFFSSVFASIDGSNVNPVYFNSTAGKDAIGYADFTVNNPATIFNFNMALTAESTTANAGKIEIGYTDDTQTQDNGFTDEILINSKQSCQANGNGYCTPQHDFKSVDVNGNGAIRVWFKFDTGYSNFKLYEFYLNAWGTTAKIPLPGAAVYSMNFSNATTLTDALGVYTLIMPLTSNTVAYTKIGYESKNFNLIFNNSYPAQTKDVILNSTNATINTTKEYLIVPNFVQGTNTNGNFKTLSHTSLLGGYQIAICPQLGGDCKTQNVPANTESTFALDPNLPIGTYQVDLTGYLGGLLDISRDVIVSTNFTVTSNVPHVDWSNGADGYFLGDTMVLGISVPSGSQDVSVTYLTNGSIIYNNSFSATGTVQNVSFVTNSNITLTQFQPGQYQGCITSGNCVTTTLFNVSNSEYSLSSPASVSWGTTFNIIYKSPHTSLLQIMDTNNNVLFTQEVPIGNSLTGAIQLNTSVLPNKQDTLTITLNRNNKIVANTTTVINPSGGNLPSPGGIDNGLTVYTNFLLLFTLPALWGLIILGAILYYARNSPQAINLGFAVAGIEAVMGFFDPFKWWVIAIVIIYAGLKYTQTRETVTGDK